MKRAWWISTMGLLVGAFGAHSFLEDVRAEVTGGEPVEVFVSTKDLEPGAKLEATSLEKVKIPGAYVDPRRVLAAESKKILGIAVLGRVRAGEGLYWSDLAGGENAAAQLSAILKLGSRAYQLSAEANPFGELVHVGDRVDVLCSTATLTQTVVERVHVLAVGQRLSDSTEQKKSTERSSFSKGLTISVLPEEAEKLLKAERSCTLRVVLRSPEDLGTPVAAAKNTTETKSQEQRSITREIEHVR